MSPVVSLNMFSLICSADYIIFFTGLVIDYAAPTAGLFA